MDNSQIENKNTRSAFLKKASLGIVSVLGLGFVGFNFLKSQSVSAVNFKAISEREANDLIRNLRSSKFRRLKPEPPPKINTATNDWLSKHMKSDTRLV